MLRKHVAFLRKQEHKYRAKNNQTLDCHYISKRRIKTTEQSNVKLLLSL